MIDINNMSEKEMRSRMKEIDKIRDELRDEKIKYENYFHEKSMKKELEDRQSFIGKCFTSKYLDDNNSKWLVAFKILNILNEPNQDCANCIAIINGYRNTCWAEYGIQSMTLPLWGPNSKGLMSYNKPKLIEFYEEISAKEFRRMSERYKNMLFREI